MNDTPTEPLREVELKGIAVSPGVAVGTALLVTTEEDRLVERTITEEEIPREIARFEEALIQTRHQIHEIQQKVSTAIGQESASIFDAHLLVVDDRSFVEEVIRGLNAKRRNVEAVLTGVAERYAEALLALEDDYLRERAADVRDVTRRILRNLSGRSTSLLSRLDQPYVIVANDLAPSDTAVLNRDRVMGFATDLGSPTSHTAIMARALGIPAVVGLHDVSVRVSTGDQLLIDGHKGIMVINPSRERLELYGKIAEVRQGIQDKLAALKEQPAVTRDGYQVMLAANIEQPADVDSLMAHGAGGVDRRAGDGRDGIEDRRAGDARESLCAGEAGAAGRGGFRGGRVRDRVRRSFGRSAHRSHRRIRRRLRSQRHTRWHWPASSCRERSCTPCLRGRCLRQRRWRSTASSWRQGTGQGSFSSWFPPSKNGE